MRSTRTSLGLIALACVVLAYGGYRLWLWRWGAHQLHVAAEATARHDFRAAGAALEQYLQVWPDDTDARLRAARTFRRADALKESLDHLQQVPDSAQLTQERLFLRAQSGNLGDMRQLVRQVEADPQRADAPLLLEAAIKGYLTLLPPLVEGRNPAEDSSEYKLAREAQAALALWRDRADTPAARLSAHFWQGCTERYTSEHAQAVASFRAALALDPEHSAARQNLALTIAQEAPLVALAHLERVLQRDPNNLLVRVGVATVRRAAGQLDEARQLLDDIVREYPTSPQPLVERGLLALDLHQVAEAESYMRRALLTAPQEPQVHIALSRVLHAAGRTAEAKGHYDEFLRLDAARTRHP